MVEHFAELIEKWCDKKGNSLLLLSKKTGVAYGVVKRYAAKEARAGLSNVLKILDVVAETKQEVNLFVKEYFQDEDGIMSSSYRNDRKVDGVDRFLRDKAGFQIIHKGWKKSGITRAEILTRYGTYGLELVDDMLDAAVLREINGKIITKDFQVVNPQHILEQAETAINCFDCDNLGDKRSIAGVLSGGLNEKAQYEAYQDVQECFRKIKEKTDSEECAGDHPVFFVGLLNHLENGEKE